MYNVYDVDQLEHKLQHVATEKEKWLHIGDFCVSIAFNAFLKALAKKVNFRGVGQGQTVEVSSG